MQFNEGLAAIKLDDKKGYINLSGKLIVEPKYEEVIFLWTEELQ